MTSGKRGASFPRALEFRFAKTGPSLPRLGRTGHERRATPRWSGHDQPDSLWRAAGTRWQTFAQKKTARNIHAIFNCEARSADPSFCEEVGHMSTESR